MNKQLSKWYDRADMRDVKLNSLYEWARDMQYERPAYDKRCYKRWVRKLSAAIKARVAQKNKALGRYSTPYVAFDPFA